MSWFWVIFFLPCIYYVKNNQKKKQQQQQQKKKKKKKKEREVTVCKRREQLLHETNIRDIAVTRVKSSQSLLSWTLFLKKGLPKITEWGPLGHHWPISRINPALMIGKKTRLTFSTN